MRHVTPLMRYRTVLTLNLIFWANGKEKRIITQSEDIRYDSVHIS